VQEITSTWCNVVFHWYSPFFYNWTLYPIVHRMFLIHTSHQRRCMKVYTHRAHSRLAANHPYESAVHPLGRTDESRHANNMPFFVPNGLWMTSRWSDYIAPLSSLRHQSGNDVHRPFDWFGESRDIPEHNLTHAIAVKRSVLTRDSCESFGSKRTSIVDDDCVRCKISKCHTLKILQGFFTEP